jgi:hypothetical protein
MKTSTLRMQAENLLDQILNGGNYYMPKKKSTPSSSGSKKQQRTLFKEGGLGRKYCPSCENFIGSSYRKCWNCDFKFEKGKTYHPPRDLTKEEKAVVSYVVGIGGRDRNEMVVHAASGDMPTKLKNFTHDEVFKWCEMMVSYGRSKNRIYLPTALKLFAMRHKFNTQKTKMRVLRYIEEWADEKRTACKDIRIRVRSTT